MTYTVSRQVMNLLIQRLNNLDGVGDAHLRTYSGRNMYGDSCLALVCNDVSQLVRFVLDLGDAVSEELDENAEQVAALVDELRVRRTRYDQLGLGWVYYWPGVEVGS